MIRSPGPSGGGELTVRMERLLGPAGSEHDRRGELRPEQLERRIDVAGVDEPPRPQLETPECFAVRLGGDLQPASSCDILYTIYLSSIVIRNKFIVFLISHFE